MIKNKIVKVTGVFAVIQLCTFSTFVFADGPSDSSEVSIVSVQHKKTSLLRNKQPLPYLGAKAAGDSTPFKLPIGATLKDIKISGVIRLLSIYRNMSQSYSDMVSSQKNISFADYPIVGVGTNNAGGFPMLELNMANSPLSKFQFAVGYSFSSALTGNTVDTSFNRLVSARNFIKFSGKWNSGPVRVGLDAGGIIWTQLSRLTMGQTNYRDNYFDRVPWDWYRNSFLRYEEYYSLSSNIGAESAGRSPMLGYVMNTEILPASLKVKMLYGVTNLNTTLANSSSPFPSYTFGTRVEEVIFKRRISGKVGLNYYSKQADTDRSRGIKDEIDIVSADFNMKVRKINFSSEFGRARINNPKSNGQIGTAFVFKTELDRAVSAYPFSAEIYRINYNYASLDGSVMNTNSSVNSGGYGTEYLYDNMLLINVVQQVGQLANNRQGYSLTAEGNIKKLKIQLGLSGSQELQNLQDTVTFQHRVNSFSRSRFRPWFMGGGNYGRIKSIWLTTYETMTITDTLDNYKKGFGNVELFLKYKFRIFNRDMVLLNFNTYNTVHKNTPFVAFNDAFVKVFFEDITASYKLGRKYSVVANFGIETAKGGKGTQETVAGSGKYIDQVGRAFGLGVDYDFTNYAGLHVRHKWMSHHDKNFVADKFRGQETTIELKIFF